jgi:hypothetical protein
MSEPRALVNKKNVVCLTHTVLTFLLPSMSSDGGGSDLSSSWQQTQCGFVSVYDPAGDL